MFQDILTSIDLFILLLGWKKCNNYIYLGEYLINCEGNQTYFTFAFWELGHQVLIVMDVGNVGLQWWCAWDLFGSQILVTTGGFELRISWIGSSNLTHKVITP